jgi:hypothetical protein
MSQGQKLAIIGGTLGVIVLMCLAAFALATFFMRNSGDQVAPARREGAGQPGRARPGFGIGRKRDHPGRDVREWLAGRQRIEPEFAGSAELLPDIDVATDDTREL